jgi:hypothetical protein
MSAAPYHRQHSSKANADGLSRRERIAQGKLLRNSPSYKCSPPGRTPAKPLDPATPRLQPLLVVSKPLSLSQVAHQYVASVMLECGGNFTSARRTLGLSSTGMRIYLDRIESGDVHNVEVKPRRAKPQRTVRKTNGKALHQVRETKSSNGL